MHFSQRVTHVAYQIYTYTVYRMYTEDWRTLADGLRITPVEILLDYRGFWLF